MIHSSYLAPLFTPKSLRHILDDAQNILSAVNFDSIAVRGSSGLLVGGALADRMNKGLFLIRKEPEHSHSGFIIEGDSDYRKYIILDDLVCTGMTVRVIRTAMETFMPLTELVGAYIYLDRLDSRLPKGYSPRLPNSKLSYILGDTNDA